MGVPLEVMAALGRALMQVGIKNASYGDLNAAIATMAPLFEAGYDGSRPACPPATPTVGVPASVVTALMGSMARNGVEVIHGEDLNAVLAALGPLCRPGGQP